MQRKYIQSLVVNSEELARDIVKGLADVNPSYAFDITESRNDHGIVTQVKIEIYKMSPTEYM